MEELLFGPLRHSGRTVIHIDMKEGPGIDMTGDLMDPAFVQSLKQRKFRSLLCSNVLEHVADRDPLCRAMRDMLPPGGHLFVTVPHRYPYHPDPIDTRFRPTVDQLLACFPGLDVVKAETIDCGSFYEALTRGVPELLLRLAWVLVPFAHHQGWVRNIHRLAWVGRRFSATCAVLRRPAT